jgi:D-alanyl-D-alanine carboxypeptidase
MGIFRYETRCETVWGHTGGFPGYTQFMAASPNGTRSVVVSVNKRLTSGVGAPGVLPALRVIERPAVCAVPSAY